MKKQLFFILVFLTLFSTNSYAQSNCTPLDHPPGAIRSKGFTNIGGQTVANDFIISANTLKFGPKKMELNLWTSNDTVAAVDLVFFNNNGKHPGVVVGDTIRNIVPTSQNIIDNEEGFQIRKVVLDFPTSIELQGTGSAPVKYWVEVIAHPTTPGNRIGWELNGQKVFGEGVNFTNTNIDYFITKDNWDGVFKISGQCTVSAGCLIPEAVTASNIGNNGANIAWSGFPDAVSYTLVYGKKGFNVNSGEGQTISVPGSQTSVTLENLQLVTGYDVYIKTICANGESIFTVPFSFSTTDIYCDMDVLVEREPISYVQFAGISNRTDAALNQSPGHEMFLETEGRVVPGQTYTFTMEGNTGGNYDDGVTVFIDWNQDGIFNNSTERYDIGILKNSTGIDGKQISGDIVVPTTVAAGKTRMRVLKEFYASTFVPDGCAWLSYGQSEDYTIVIDLEDCVGTPTGGVAVVDPKFGNVNNNYVVSASNYSVSNGIVYQWQSNTSNQGWIDQGSGHSVYQSYTATAPSQGGVEVEWRLKITCTASQQVAYSDIAKYTTYTELTYCAPVLSCSDDDVIKNVSFQEINNTTTCSPNGFSDYTNLTANVTAGENYSLSVDVGSGWNVESVSVWIDYDKDGVFEQNEFYYLGTGSGNTITGNIAIPGSLAQGDYRMRVRVAAVDYNAATWDMSCNTAQKYGETEDYTVRITSLAVNDVKKSSVQLFPNPTSDMLNISADRPISQVAIFNMLGQKVMEKTINSTQSQLNVSALKTGVYILQTTTDGTQENINFIKK